jgi:isopenicillin-N epimerase
MTETAHSNRPPFGREARAEFQLDPDVVHLNHGSYGAVPKRVADAQRAMLKQIEADPSQFMAMESRPRLREIAGQIGSYIGADADGIALVENATNAVNVVLRSLSFSDGDEIVVTNQTYGAVLNTVTHICSLTGAIRKDIELPYPAHNPDDVVAAYRDAIGEKTRLVVVDHITSPTALLLPIEPIIRLAHEAGALVLVDGAHAPGMIPLNVAALAPDFYTGNCHKWLCAPRGCAFLWCAEPHRANMHPLVISHGFGGGFEAEFDWVGTRDASAQFALAEAFAFRERYGDAETMAHNHQLVLKAAAMLAERWGTEVGAPAEMTGSMATVRLPLAGPADTQAALAIRARLHAEHKIQVPVNALAGAFWVRISAQIYNEMADYERLAEAGEMLAP